MARRHAARYALLAFLHVGLLFNVGCQQIIALVSSLIGGGGGGGGSGIFNPGSIGGGGGLFPPGLGGSGRSPPLAPNSLLPAPPL